MKEKQPFIILLAIAPNHFSSVDPLSTLDLGIGGSSLIGVSFFGFLFVNETAEWVVIVVYASKMTKIVGYFLNLVPAKWNYSLRIEPRNGVANGFPPWFKDMSS